MLTFESASQAAEVLSATGYLATPEVATAVYLAQELGKPILAEGPAGTGKTELAKSIAAATKAPLIRLQCYEGLDEARALFEWDYRKQLLSLQTERQGWAEARQSLFSREFLLPRPLLQALVADEPVVLLIDEVDRLEMETEALLLEVLADFQITVPELGTIKATHQPFVVLTSNDTRDLSEALRRRCLYLHLGYPDVERETAIIEQRLPGIRSELAAAVARAAAEMRRLELSKEPSIAEVLDWARALQIAGKTSVNQAEVRDGVSLLGKTKDDADAIRRHWEPAAP